MVGFGHFLDDELWFPAKTRVRLLRLSLSLSLHVARLPQPRRNSFLPLGLPAPLSSWIV
jgi:hypothetical protein